MSGRSPVDSIALVEATGTRGTGFLVRATDGRLLVLTAGHVADKAPLTVTFAAHDFPSPATVARRVAGDPMSAPLRGTADWAALECTKTLPAALTPIELDELDGPPATPWETFGYPNLYGTPGKGGALHGEVRRVPGGIRPYCIELDGEVSDQASGISGAPCLVADVAIGVIHKVLAWGGATVAGSLLVVPASVIAAESGGALAVATDPRLPYFADTLQPLEGVIPPLLQRMETVLELASQAGQQPDALRRRVARGLLIAAPERVAEALVSAKISGSLLQAAPLLLVHRESLGIHATTAQAALRLLDAGGAAALNATLEVSTRLLLRRVSWARGYGERWYMPRKCLIVCNAEDNAAAVVEAVREAARNVFLTPDPDSVLKTRTVFAAIYRVLPRPETRQALVDAFPKLRAIFCSDRPTDPAAPDLGVEWLEPFTAGDEQAWRATCLAAREHLRDNANISHDDNQFDRME